MATEIERKFLVTGAGWRSAAAVYYCQGYLNRDKHRTVRVRIAGSAAWLTIKGMAAGISRLEFEYPIPLEDAQSLLELCQKPLIEKYRRVIEFEGKQWEVDEFLGENAGLIIAELELESEAETFTLPDWVGKEVSHDPRYFNVSLSQHPFKDWK